MSDWPDHAIVPARGPISADHAEVAAEDRSLHQTDLELEESVSKDWVRSMENLKFHAFPHIFTPPSHHLRTTRRPSPDLSTRSLPGHLKRG